jgi:hypothetical protein
MAEKNIILHCSGGHHEIFQNSILSAYVPKKNILIAPWWGKHFSLFMFFVCDDARINMCDRHRPFM